jgi:serine/threonine protein kinase
MPAAAPTLPPMIASRYVPVRLIATGGMGAVYEVEHARTGEHLALKLLLSSVGSSPEELERFKREARASARIKSEHVVRVTDAGIAPELGGAPFLVMELLEGTDLEREAEAARPRPATVVEWLRQVAPALDKAHRLGIIHRDLKPENLFLARGEDRAPIVKILDFGIVKMTEEGPGATGSGQILGTPQYMAPEQASTGRRITSAADRYSLGLVAYRLLTGVSYYEGDVLSILAQLLHERLELPSQRHPGFGSAFDTWFLKACHRDPAARFTSATEQIEELSAAIGLPAVPGRELVRGVGRSPSRRTLAGVALVATALAGATLVWALLDRDPGTNRPGAAPPTSMSSPAPPITPPLRRSELSAPTAPGPLPEAAAAGPSSPPQASTRSSTPAPRAARRHIPHPTGVAGAATPVTELPRPADPYADQK